MALNRKLINSGNTYSLLVGWSTLIYSTYTKQVYMKRHKRRTKVRIYVKSLNL